MLRVRSRRIALALTLGLAASQVACVTGAEKLVKGGVQGGLEGTLEALNDPHNKQLLRQLLHDPDIQAAAHDLTEAITGGALDGLTEAERQKKLREISDAYIRTVSASVGKALNEDISPAVTRTVESVVGGAVASAVSPDNKRLTASFIDGVTRSAITAFTQSTAKGLRDDLGPALNKVIAEDLGPALNKVIAEDLGPALNKMIVQELKPAIGEMLNAETNAAIGGLARNLTKEIVLGANDGMSELGISLSPTKSSGGLGLFGWMAIILGLIVTILVILLVRTFLTRRSLENERARSERMLLNVLRTIQYTDTDDPNKAPDLDALLARARMTDAKDFDDPRNETWLSGLLAQARVPDKAARVAPKPPPKPLPPRV